MVYCIKRREDLLIDSWCKKTINIEQKSLWKSRPLFKSRPSDRFKSLTSFEWKKKRQARPCLSAPPLACRVSWTHMFPLPSGNGLALRTFLSPAWTAATFLRPRARRVGDASTKLESCGPRTFGRWRKNPRTSDAWADAADAYDTLKSERRSGQTHFLRKNCARVEMEWCNRAWMPLFLTPPKRASLLVEACVLILTSQVGIR